MGDLRDRVKLQNRDITEPAFGSSDFGEDFDLADEVWASVKTLSGRTIFDGVHTDIVVTHRIHVRYDPSVTSETWIQLADGRRLDVVQVEDLEERHEFLELLCTERGKRAKEAAKA